LSEKHENIVRGNKSIKAVFDSQVVRLDVFWEIFEVVVVRLDVIIK
jgi:hypothetical protein